MNNFEANVSALLESKRLDWESKIAIGSLRRYGDATITYNGLKQSVAPMDAREFGDEDYEEGAPAKSSGDVEEYWTRTMDLLDEVISIARSNGFGEDPPS